MKPKGASHVTNAVKFSITGNLFTNTLNLIQTFDSLVICVELHF